MPKKYKRGFINSVTYEKMYRAYLNAKKAKRYRRDVILFNLRYEERLSIICYYSQKTVIKNKIFKI